MIELPKAEARHRLAYAQTRPLAARTAQNGGPTEIPSDRQVARKCEL